MVLFTLKDLKTAVDNIQARQDMEGDFLKHDGQRIDLTNKPFDWTRQSDLLLGMSLLVNELVECYGDDVDREYHGITSETQEIIEHMNVSEKQKD